MHYEYLFVFQYLHLNSNILTVKPFQFQILSAILSDSFLTLLCQ